MNIFKNFFIGALLLVAVSEYNVQAMEPSKNQLKKIKTGPVCRYFQGNKNQAAENQEQVCRYFQGAGNQQQVQQPSGTTSSEITQKGKKRKPDEAGLNDESEQSNKRQKTNDIPLMDVEPVATTVNLEAISALSADDFNVYDEHGRTFFHNAVLSGNKDLIQATIDKIDSINALNKIEGIEATSIYRKIDKYNKDALAYAAQMGDIEIVCLLRKRYNIGTLYIKCAFENYHLDIVKYFHNQIKHDRAAEIAMRTAYGMKYKAVCDKHLDALKCVYDIQLRDSKPYISLNYEWELLFQAIVDGSAEIIKWILDRCKNGSSVDSFNNFINRKGADNKSCMFDSVLPNEKESDTKTLISYAIECGNEEIITLILDAGAEVTNEVLAAGKKKQFSQDLEMRLRDLNKKINENSSCIIS